MRAQKTKKIGKDQAQDISAGEDYNGCWTSDDMCCALAESLHFAHV